MARISHAMRFIPLFCALLLAIFSHPSLGKPKGGASRSDARQAKLASLAASGRGVISADSDLYNEVTSTPRNYSAAILLTALSPQFGCDPCVKFHPEYESVAKSWAKKKDDSHFFVSLDFNKGREIFQKLQLQHVPILYFFPATTGPRASSDSSPVTYDFNRAGFEGDDFAEWMSNEKGIAVTYSKPIPWKLLATVAASGATAAAVVIFLAPKIGFFTGSKIIWEILTLGTVIVMCSGYMWNQIRGAPYSGVGAGGKIEYFAGGFQNQFVAETQIVSCIYALLAFSVVALIIFVPNQQDPVRQRAGVYVWSAVFLGTFSLLFAIFRTKNPAYPFRLFL